jgi:hypothetical protein
MRLSPVLFDSVYRQIKTVYKLYARGFMLLRNHAVEILFFNGGFCMFFACTIERFCFRQVILIGKQQKGIALPAIAWPRFSGEYALHPGGMARK